MNKTLLVAAISLVSTGLQAAPAVEPSLLMEELITIGTREDARHIAGSGSVVDAEQLRTEVSVDINQLLKTVPGVYIREEDGAGLRPNIGIRGATSERSEKITLMEDGVMIAPAPYSNPAAYYFPTMMRQSSIEILKGAPLLRFGPQTTGGVMNLVSTPIAAENSGGLQLVTDERGSADIHAHYSATQGQFSAMVETVQRQGEGFKDIDRSNRDTGFEIEDYVVKVGWESDGSGPRQSVLLKGQYSEEQSNETYLGLTDSDFNQDANRRYGLSDLDQMENRHTGLTATYNIELSDDVEATAIVYNNTFKRDWFKLSDGGDYIDDANAGDATAQGILNGDIDVAGLKYKHNNRAYESRGVELNFDVAVEDHQLQFGGRIHTDEMDRFQPTERYDQVSGQLIYTSTDDATGSNNRLEEADAETFWAIDDWQVTDELNVNLALRHERIKSSRREFGDEARTLLTDTRRNTTQEWLPGASFTYQWSDQLQILAGVHKGFSPLGGGAEEGEKAETSINYEAGVRFDHEGLFVEAISFYSDFSEKSESCSLGNPCSNGDTSGTYTTGEAVISGLELQLGTLYNFDHFTVPVDVAYTYTKAAISADNAVSGVSDGDLLKDVPENVFSIRAGIEHASNWNNYAVVKYIDDSCVSVGCNQNSDPLDRTESLWVVDMISRFAMTEQTDVFLKVENLLDKQAIVSRTPDGARPNKPMTASVGVNVTF